MSFDPKLVFEVMACAYRNGVLDKIIFLQGQSLKLVMEETNLNLVDLMNRMDETTEETLFSFDRFLEKSDMLLRVANRDFPMKMVSRLLDFRFVKDLIINKTKGSIIKVMTSEQISAEGAKALHRQEKSLAGEG